MKTSICIKCTKYKLFSSLTFKYAIASAWYNKRVGFCSLIVAELNFNTYSLKPHKWMICLKKKEYSTFA